MTNNSAHDKGETAIQTVPAQNPTSPSSVENHTTRLMEALLGRINATPVGSEERVRAVQIAEVCEIFKQIRL